VKRLVRVKIARKGPGREMPEPHERKRLGRTGINCPFSA